MGGDKSGDKEASDTTGDFSQREDGGIDIRIAEEEFNALSRQLTAISERQRPYSDSKDLEKGGEESANFDLRDYLSSSNDAHQRAGIKHKV